MAIRFTPTGPQSYPDPTPFNPSGSGSSGSSSTPVLSGSSPLNQPAVFRDSRTGNLSGIELPNGKVFLGLTPKEVREIAAREEKKKQLPAGAEEMSEAIRQQQQRAGNEETTAKLPGEFERILSTGEGIIQCVPRHNSRASQLSV